jgi:hypothetical protein
VFTPEIRIAVADTMTTGATAVVTILSGSPIWSSGFTMTLSS